MPGVLPATTHKPLNLAKPRPAASNIAPETALHPERLSFSIWDGACSQESQKNRKKTHGTHPR
jgi:hypothetical protein